MADVKVERVVAPSVTSRLNSIHKDLQWQEEKGCRSKIPKQIVLDKNLCLMVNSLKMKDGPPVIVLGPIGQLEGAPVDEAVAAGEGGHHLERKDYCRLSSCPKRSSESINLSIKIMGDYRLVHYHLEKKDYRSLSTCQLVHKDNWRLAPCPQRFYTCILN